MTFQLQLIATFYLCYFCCNRVGAQSSGMVLAIRLEIDCNQARGLSYRKTEYLVLFLLDFMVSQPPPSVFPTQERLITFLTAAVHHKTIRLVNFSYNFLQFFDHSLVNILLLSKALTTTFDNLVSLYILLRFDISHHQSLCFLPWTCQKKNQNPNTKEECRY